MGRGRSRASSLLYAPVARSLVGRAAPRRAGPGPAGPEDEGDGKWHAGDNATWRPWFSPGPVDVALAREPDDRGVVEVTILTPGIEETGQLWPAELHELEPA